MCAGTMVIYYWALGVAMKRYAVLCTLSLALAGLLVALHAAEREKTVTLTISGMT